MKGLGRTASIAIAVVVVVIIIAIAAAYYATRPPSPAPSTTSVPPSTTSSTISTTTTSALPSTTPPFSLSSLLNPNFVCNQLLGGKTVTITVWDTYGPTEDKAFNATRPH